MAPDKAKFFAWTMRQHLLVGPLDRASRYKRADFIFFLFTFGIRTQFWWVGSVSCSRLFFGGMMWIFFGRSLSDIKIMNFRSKCEKFLNLLHGEWLIYLFARFVCLAFTSFIEELDTPFCINLQRDASGWLFRVVVLFYRFDSIHIRFQSRFLGNVTPSMQTVICMKNEKIYEIITNSYSNKSKQNLNQML